MINNNSQSIRDTICLDIANSILSHDGNDKLTRLSIAQINKLIKTKCAEYRLDSTPKYSEILRFIPNDSYYKKLLRIKPVKTQSGVAVVTVMPMPYDCPHGRCIYCPGGKDYNTPLSYIGTEPSTIIAQQLNYDPYEQVLTKVRQLADRGHEVSKVELVVVGGTFPYYPKEYQIYFAEKLYRALNSFKINNESVLLFSESLKELVKENNPSQQTVLNKSTSHLSPPSSSQTVTAFSSSSSSSSSSSIALSANHPAPNLESLINAQLENQSASVRCVGLTVETKPDYCKLSHVNMMLDLGTTRIELGVQSLSDQVFRLVNRGHSLEDVYEAFYVSRNCGFKIGAHMMPGLPGSDFSQDLKDAVTLFTDDRLKPDMLKIYPTLVVPNTGLFELHQRGKYDSYQTNDLVKLLVEVKKKIPPWVRIMRIQREIEPEDIVAGPKIGNVRQLVLDELKSQGIKCKCIRCREVGLLNQSEKILDMEPTLTRTDYFASGGKEIFLSYEMDNGNLLLGFLRLRIMTNPLRKELQGDSPISTKPATTTKSGATPYFNKDRFIDESTKPSNNYVSAIVRELHVYGLVESISRPNKKINQTMPPSTTEEKDSYFNTISLDIFKKESIDNLAKLAVQHKGLGKSLLAEAEKICKDEFNLKTLSVISAIGTRDYYRKFGYTNNGPYVTKTL
ncbi:tRNA uridine(34) 5-carboxymethylaminomethyl modification radical SAM/GNAT enzyme Elp3 [Candidatus Nitrosocosmicus sp. SS]|jgi:elongator complex protein 3|uniref:tRNA uridine(34) 5-carboxymethylaminomethyl modification radical SAM/GNAT enzyme Elp3 n=1 Tax=Candidatus Nitrosocosmicus agrestis TaxID=2563600 RepID=UPI00122E520F|nr:tRNA uridine(34) 5-carboxymethylaminomethyl modification radical SAM/GNAT enzyme Elp3 [Candidatus Nitrosocosmicus sp. SS]KAA2279262.1 tRNA uridine(34) 5-carboxymethylaminomethyl modification radical SAM/GNAT enzyme Elp3 [Candidatus Nitrosocosmicus sp. SS]KAF0867886.1 tRNA uridine(34) 5-carboxymethylaminomethyl modification radical SAM/GNAT enzyme Elp3 [Candidatus Nitrosocosmicus sp. SS]